MNNFEISQKSISNNYAFILKELIINLETNVEDINNKLDKHEDIINKNNLSNNSSDNYLTTSLKINENKNKIVELEKKIIEQAVLLKSQENISLETLDKVKKYEQIIEKIQSSLNDYERKLSTLQLNNLSNDNLIQDMQNIKSKIISLIYSKTA